MMLTPQKAQEESDTSAWGAEATVEEDREERLVRELTDILGQNKASTSRKDGNMACLLQLDATGLP